MIIMKLVYIGLLTCFAFVNLLCIFADCERTSQKIYTYLEADYPCFRRLNATHQVGCSSARKGSVGVVYYVANVTDFEWVLEHGPYAPYIVIIEPSYFNKKNLTKMKNSGKVSGVFVISPALTSYPTGFSPDHECPNERYGMYTNTSNYNGCSVKWNKFGDGTFFEDWIFPIFLIENEDDYKQLVEHCYQRFNAPIHGKPRDWPLCAAELYSSMYAAKDTKTCMRRSQMITNLNPVKFCDPLGDYNIWSLLLPLNKSVEIENRSVIVVAARLDSFSMFDNIGPGGDSAASGIVTLLSIAETLNRVSKNISTDKNVMFILFNGEAFDYIGSSRIVYDMLNNKFPSPLSTSIASQPPLISLNKISHFIELNQVGIRNPSRPAIYIHTDPIATQNSNINSTVNEMADILNKESEFYPGVSVVRTPSASTLPPASLQSFLKKDLEIPGIVITDHEDVYSNAYYNSINDGRQMDFSSREYIEHTATLVSRLVYRLLTNQNASTIDPKKELVNEMFDCYKNFKDCELFNETSPVRQNKFSRNPSYYVGVDGNANFVRVFTTQLMAYLVGDVVVNKTSDDCVTPNDNLIYTYRWMVGNESSSGFCMKSAVSLTAARSPAFEIDGYDFDSGVYPSWTESVWNSFTLRIFLKPSFQQEVVTLCIGLLVLVLSFALVWFINDSSNLLFTNNAGVVTAGVAC